MKTSKADLMDVCGMEGITGVIVGAKLRILPKMKKTISIFQTEDIEEVLSMVRRLKLEKDVYSLDFFSKRVSRIIGFPEKYNLIIEFNSDRGKIKAREYEKIINLRDRVYYLLAKNGYYNSEDPKFFFDKVEEFVLYLESNDIPYFGHLGSGIICAFFKDDEIEKRKDVLDVIKKMRVKFGKYGIGIARKDFIDSFDAKIIQRVKLRHDPFGKLAHAFSPSRIAETHRISHTLRQFIREKFTDIRQCHALPIPKIHFLEFGQHINSYVMVAGYDSGPNQRSFEIAGINGLNVCQPQPFS